MDRRLVILNAIIKEFIETAEPVGSQTIVLGYHFSVSPATIRNEMSALEDEGLIFQPHTSSGRVPTDTGYRLYVDELADYETAEKEATKALQKAIVSNKIQKAREKIYDGVRILAHATGHVSFATLPDNRRAFYLGVSQVLLQPEFSNDPLQASKVMEVLEDSDNFVNTLHQLEIGNDVKIFIGRENILPQIQSCAVVVCKYKLEGFQGFFGVLGPTRMKYPFNHAIVKKIRDMIEG